MQEITDKRVKIKRLGKFYGVPLSPVIKGVSRWEVYKLTIIKGEPELVKLMPEAPDHLRFCQRNGWTYYTGSEFPRYHIKVNTYGTSHIPFIKEKLSMILQVERDIKIESSKLEFIALSSNNL